MSTPTWTFATSFLTSFQRTTSGPSIYSTPYSYPHPRTLIIDRNPIDLEARIHASQSQTQTQTILQDEVQAFVLELAKLTKSLADATGSLPSYDQRQCELVCTTTYNPASRYISYVL
jgi:hypothetical protein